MNEYRVNRNTLEGRFSIFSSKTLFNYRENRTRSTDALYTSRDFYMYLEDMYILEQKSKYKILQEFKSLSYDDLQMILHLFNTKIVKDCVLHDDMSWCILEKNLEKYSDNTGKNIMKLLHKTAFNDFDFIVMSYIYNRFVAFVKFTIADFYKNDINDIVDFYVDDRYTFIDIDFLHEQREFRIDNKTKEVSEKVGTIYKLLSLKNKDNKFTKKWVGVRNTYIDNKFNVLYINGDELIFNNSIIINFKQETVELTSFAYEIVEEYKTSKNVNQNNNLKSVKTKNIKI